MLGFVEADDQLLVRADAGGLCVYFARAIEAKQITIFVFSAFPSSCLRFLVSADTAFKSGIDMAMDHPLQEFFVVRNP